MQGTPFPLGPRAMFESVIATTLPGELQQSVVGDTLGCTYVLHVHVVTAGVVTGNLKSRFIIRVVVFYCFFDSFIENQCYC